MLNRRSFLGRAAMAIGAIAILDPELEAWQKGQKLVIIPDGMKPLPPSNDVELQYDFHVSDEDRKLSGPAFHRRFFDPAAAFFDQQRARLDSVTEPVIVLTQIPKMLMHAQTAMRSPDGKMLITPAFDLSVGGHYATITQIVRVRPPVFAHKTCAVVRTTGLFGEAHYRVEVG